ncbi:MAG: DUF998 domain-containing protein [Methanobacteriaceae archaeon]|nr:DUF998 domain-containing protein [Methanobacteriaceae archaeon]MDP2836220.1 DUF998 domain-containing protein [Methanobacteriaceae archaeon]MDP3033667.1 DUF998 domain-containing protein [Methanobacteriaceae archaeon]MDP3484681.1 DUF998 domain-containing protein [Methanobacteriaceae archaeon]MDP3624708.1 DUF998 domain-containing protein [Methanobacteriaceae archaeon]
MTNNTQDTSNKLNLTRAGLLFFLAGSIILMGIITAETFYPEKYTYTTSDSMISDLGATEPPNSIITHPSATIFNFSMRIVGILILLGTYFLFRALNDKIVTILIGLLGLGALGVGIFPGNVNPQHPLFALTTFISGGLSAIYSYRLINSPFKYLSVLFGITGLFFLFTASIFIPIMGGGGVERWVAYPIVLWLIGFGGYLMGLSSKEKEIVAK